MIPAAKKSKCPEICDVLMTRDKVTFSEAEETIDAARAEFKERLADGSMGIDELDELMSDHFGLEPDYIVEFIGSCGY